MWDLRNEKGEILAPLKYSNGKTQEDVVQEVLDAIAQGHKIIFIRGTCGSGKSAIALNVARAMGRASVVVPVKFLQMQYEVDYMQKLHLIRNERKMRIGVITGRNNHPCLFNPNVNADDRLLPCHIEVKKENYDFLLGYIKMNPFVNVKDFENIDDIKRFSVAPACQYWSPIIGKDWFGEDYGLVDADKIEYQGLNNQKFVYFRRKQGCGFYEQFMSYIYADTIIFNSKIYELECLLNRKPATDVEIIDECDEFLDNLGNEKKINLNKLSLKVTNLIAQCKDDDLKRLLFELGNLITAILKEPDRREITQIRETKIYELLDLFSKNTQLLEYEDLEPYYVIAENFRDYMDETYVQYNRNKYNERIAQIVNVNLKKKLKSLLDKNKVFVMMSGTLHSKKVLKEIFGIEDYKVIEAETAEQGFINTIMTKFERDFSFRNFESGKWNRKDYLEALEKTIITAPTPVLIHVNAYSDLPTEDEAKEYNLTIQTQERLTELQDRYKKGELVQMFKEGKTNYLYSTRCGRGVDFPGTMCNSIVLTKYPYPSMHSLFWQVLKRTNSEGFTDFYFDKARREFLQRIYRALRSKFDRVNILSPDLRVLRNLA